MMKKACIVLAAVLALGGCATGSFLGLATKEYVDSQEAAIKQQAAEIERLKAEMADYKALKDQARAAIDDIESAGKTIDDLKAASSKAESRISSLPREVIAKIVKALQSLYEE